MFLLLGSVNQANQRDARIAQRKGRERMEPARAGLRSLLFDALRNAPREELPILLWPIVCGTAVASRTPDITIENGALRVPVPDAAWRAQLQSFSGQYLSTLNQLLQQAGAEPIRAITFYLRGA